MENQTQDLLSNREHRRINLDKVLSNMPPRCIHGAAQIRMMLRSKNPERFEVAYKRGVDFIVKNIKEPLH